MTTNEELNLAIEQTEEQRLALAETPIEETVTEETATEEKPSEEEAIEVLPEDSIFKPFETLRADLIKSGIDMKAQDEIFNSGGTVEPAIIEKMAELKGVSVEDASAFMKLAYANRDALGKVQELDSLKASQYLTEVNEAAGGDYEELKAFVADNAHPDKIDSWNALLGTNDKKLQLITLREMNEFRTSKGASAKKSADLSVLTKSTQSTTPAATGTVVEGLVDNPLRDASATVLANIMLDQKNPLWGKANAVCKAKFPTMAR